MLQVCQNIVNSTLFTRFITAVILFAGVLVGLETYPSMVNAYGNTLELANLAILMIFTVEVVLKIASHGRKSWLYFTDPWNCFDFIIVAVLYLPVNSQFVAVLRLARILRVLRLITVLPRLQILVGTLLKSIPSMGYVGLLLLLLFYCYAVLAVFLFGANDPVHFGDLQTSLLSLFRVVTLEDWTDIMYIQMYGSDIYAYANPQNLPYTPQARPLVGALFFVSFVLLGTMIILNLFIGVIMTAMDETRTEEQNRKRLRLCHAKHISVPEEFDLVRHELKTLATHLDTLQKRLSDEASPDTTLASHEEPESK